MYQVRTSCPFYIYALVILSCSLSSFAQAKSSAQTISEAQAQQKLNSLPLAFEQMGSTEGKDARYVVHRLRMSSDFTADGVHFLLPAGKGKVAELGMVFGKRSAPILGEQPLPGKTNYFRGNDPANWRSGISTYSRIRYSQLWPGIDLIFYGNGEHLEHDFVVAPGVEPRQIEFQLNGAQKISITPAGDLSVTRGEASMLFKKPLAYQETGSGRQSVAAGYRLAGNKVSFTLGRYDKHRALTIDPILSFSTLLAGSLEDELFSLALDAAGNIYVSGTTFSTDFPTASPLQSKCASCPTSGTDAFISKLDPTGSTLIYSTFLGGNDYDFADSIVVDSNGQAIVGGETLSSDFPAVNITNQFVAGAGRHLFMASLAANGGSLNYSGVIGPLGPGPAFDAKVQQNTVVLVALDGSGNAYAASQTLFDSFPTTPGALSPVVTHTTPATPILVVLKLSPTGTLVYSTAVPGNAPPPSSISFFANPNTFFQHDIAVDSGGNAYVAGSATSGLPVTAGVIGSVFTPDTTLATSDAEQGFLFKLNPTGSALGFATYIPASTDVTGIKLDSTGIYLAGNTVSTSFPVSANAFRPTLSCGGCKAGYLLKINSTATANLLGTYLSTGSQPTGAQQGSFYQFALDSSRNIYLAGNISTFPLKNPLIDGSGANLAELSSDFSTILFSTVMFNEFGTKVNIALSPSGKIIIAGTNTGFPTTPGSFEPNPPPTRQTSFETPNISAIDVSVPAPSVCLNPNSFNFGAGVIAPGTTSAPQTSTVTNCGNADLHISSVASNSPDYAVSTTCPLAPSAIAPAGTCTVSATYSPVDANTSGGLVISNDTALKSQTVSLFGVAKAPSFLAQPTSLTFLETPVSSFSGLSVRVLNNGFTNLTISTVSASGDFTASGCVGVTLAPPDFVPPFGPQFHSCDITVQFMPTVPGLRKGTLTITDNTLNSPHSIPLQGPAISAWPAPVLAAGTSIGLNETAGGTAGNPGGAKTLVLSGGGFSRLTTAKVDGIIFDNFSRTIQIANPQEIDVTLFDNDFGDVGEAPVQVTTPTPGGGVSNTTINIFAPVKNTNLIFRQIEFLSTAQSMVIGPVTGLIYVSNGSNFLSSPNLSAASIVVLDPSTQRVVSGLVQFPHVPIALAISDDEQFLYAAFTENNTVAQISLPSGTINFMASLGSDPALGAYNATAIRVLPGHPHTWVAALQPVFDIKPIALKVFDDATARATTVEHGNSTSTFPGKLLFVGSDTGTVYSIDSTSLYRFTINANGVTLKDKTAGLGAEDFATDGAMLYLSTGAIIDPSSLLNANNFTLAAGPAHAVVVDAAASRAIFSGVGSTSSTGLIQAFNTKTFASVGSFNTPFPGANALLRWGSNGLALGLGGIVLTRTSLTGNSALLAPFHIGANFGQAPIGTAQISAGQNATYQLGITGINGFNGPVTFSCSNLPKFASCSFSQNPVTPGGSFVVTVSTHQTSTASAAPAGSIMKSGTGFIVIAGLLSLPFALTFAGRRYRGKLLALCLLITIIGCGGGGGNGGGGGSTTPTPPISPTPTTNNTPIGTYDVILTGTSSAGTRHVTLQLIVL